MLIFGVMYTMDRSICTEEEHAVEIGVAVFRAELKRWLGEARAGEEVIITDRGVAVARLTGVDTAPILEQLESEGVVRLPRGTSRPQASGRRRVRARRPVSELLSLQRD
jgi:prevent-host-death family protein